MEVRTKANYIALISSTIETGKIFVYTAKTTTPSQLLFACDVFRRRNHDVVVDIEANQSGVSSVHVIIHPQKNCIDLTICRTESVDEILKRMNKYTKKIRIRGCGCVIDTVFVVIDHLIRNGWYIEKNTLNSSTQKNGIQTHINTTLQAVLRRG
jgi:hypothetical protein|tara:strand:+ start:293 stop:754 length:462 start_codon:yes stop_codon:yes gene_type:complete